MVDRRRIELLTSALRTRPSLNPKSLKIKQISPSRWGGRDISGARAKAHSSARRCGADGHNSGGLSCCPWRRSRYRGLVSSWWRLLVPSYARHYAECCKGTSGGRSERALNLTGRLKHRPSVHSHHRREVSGTPRRSWRWCGRANGARWRARCRREWVVGQVGWCPRQSGGQYAKGPARCTGSYVVRGAFVARGDGMRATVGFSYQGPPSAAWSLSGLGRFVR